MTSVPTPSPAHARRLAACVGAGLLAFGGAAYADSGTTSCPGSPIEPPREPQPAPPPPPPPDDGWPGADGAWNLVLGDSATLLQLTPGSTRKTPGEPLSPHLNGPVILQSAVPFSFLANDNLTISGTLNVQVVNADDKTCDYYWWMKLDPTPHRIRHVLVYAFTHPASGLYGDWRNDLLPNGIPSKNVHRSTGAGNRIDFSLGTGLPGGGTSRMLMLDSAVGFTHLKGTVRVEADDGSMSAPMVTWVPAWP